MAPTPSKATDARRKSGGKPSWVVTLTVDPTKLREVWTDDATPAEDTPAQDTPMQDTPMQDTPTGDTDDVKQSPDSSSTQPAASGPAGADNASDSNAATPQAEGTPAPGAMGPPDGSKKKGGVKRSAANTNGAASDAPKQRGKPGPKKKPRLEDGTIDHGTAANRGGGPHKLGPKANLGAINAGLRALDRSGKPCRKWARGGFRLKTFTGVVWEVPRWTAPPKQEASEGTPADESAVPSAEESSGKENKENPAAENASAVNSNSGADAEMQSAAASSPAPMAVAAAS